MASQVSKPEYANDEIEEITKDASCDSIETDTHGVYFTRTSNIAPKHLTKKIVRKTLQRIKKSPSNKTALATITKTEHNHTKPLCRNAFAYDEYGYTIANPENDPADVNSLVTNNTARRLTQQGEGQTPDNYNECLRTFLSWRNAIRNCQCNKRLVACVTLIVFVLTIFIVGFILGSKSSGNKTSNKTLYISEVLYSSQLKWSVWVY